MSAPPDEQSGYLSSLSKLSPWPRSPAMPPSKGKDEPDSTPLLQQQKGADHRVLGTRHKLSQRKYPADCPPMRVQWFHAVDVPKRRPNPAGERKEEEKKPAAPKKYAAFSKTDSKAIEAAFQKLGDEEHAAEMGRKELNEGVDTRGPKPHNKPSMSIKDDPKSSGVKVPVNEDYLFDVDVEARELGPAYWLGPVYDVRRGTWFYQEGTVQRPCDENLAAQLEEGYLKVKAWRFMTTTDAKQQKQRSVSQPRTRPTSWPAGEEGKGSTSIPSTPGSLVQKNSDPDLRVEAATKAAEGTESTQNQPSNTYRLFGAHMSSVVTYQDANTAWLLTDDFMSRMNYTMYQRFAGGGHFAGSFPVDRVKMTRGYVPTGKKPEAKDDKDDKSTSATKQAHGQEGQNKSQGDEDAAKSNDEEEPMDARRRTLERQVSYLLEDTQDPAKQDEERRRRDEREIEDDYKEQDGDEQGRDIEHLILVTHGIGQRLGLRLDSVNFVHDVNTLRKTLKAVYAESPDLRALNAELDSHAKSNCRVQVLPICWRHLLDFPKHSLKQNRKEHDLGDSGFGDDDQYPSLNDITVEGVPAVRNLITDLALDILLYQSPAYKDHISRIVLEECNRIYHLFMARNPTFNGKVSMIGHSLGSAIMFDLLCRQGRKDTHPRRDKHPMKLDFEVEDFYALGSPIGLFQMLKGRNITGREQTIRSRNTSATMDDPMLDTSALGGSGKRQTPNIDELTGEMPVSSPKCAQVFNIFHPTDPISYRMEPLISPMMSTLKPQPLPYTKRGIFGAPVGQGLTGISNRVGQSVSSLWSSMSSGLASSLLTRGLGYTGDEPARTSNTAGDKGKSSAPLSMGGGTGSGQATGPLPAEGTKITKVDEEKQAKLASDALAAGEKGQHPPTLIDQELETLYAGFEKERKGISEAHARDSPHMNPDELHEAEERGKKLRKEEAKVRRLNSNGRVDYAIQEGAFDINLLAAIASHLSYWADEDVSHFMISQLLSRHRVVTRRQSDRSQ
ncbi:hypothetical protein Q7P37_003184 [Cladosporium fusiforme]